MKLGDAQTFLLRVIVVCTVGLLGSLLRDVGHNLFHAMGLNATATPVNFGVYQIFGVGFFGFFLVISAFEFWTYYKPKEWE